MTTFNSGSIGFHTAAGWGATFPNKFGNDSGYTDYWAGFICDIPQGSTINSAYMALTAGNDDSGTTVNATIVGIDDGDATSIGSSLYWDNTTTATVSWNGVGAWTNSSTYNTGSLSGIVQEIVNRSDFHSGNYIWITIRDNGSSSNAHRGVGSATLTVTWTAPADKSISGIVSRFGTGVNGVTMTFSGGFSGTVETSGGGTYTKNVSHDSSGIVTPTKAGETFTPTHTDYTNVISNQSSQNYAMDMYAMPKVSLAYTTRNPIYSFCSYIPVVSIGYTSYPPSRNYYNIDTIGIHYSTLEPVIGTGLTEVRARFYLNAIGQRISLKFQNVESVNLILNDCGIAVSELYRRDSDKLNAKGNRISLKFQNNESAKEFELQYLKIIDEIYEHQTGTSMNVKGNHLSFKFQNNTAGTPFELQYLKYFGEVYENQ
jgi:hypothetical protein